MVQGWSQASVVCPTPLQSAWLAFVSACKEQRSKPLGSSGDERSYTAQNLPYGNVLYKWLSFLPKCCLLLVQFLCISRAVFKMTHYFVTFCQRIIKPTVTEANSDGSLQNVSNTWYMHKQELSGCSDHGLGTVCSNCGDLLLNSPGFCHWFFIRGGSGW